MHQTINKNPTVCRKLQNKLKTCHQNVRMVFLQLHITQRHDENTFIHWNVLKKQSPEWIVDRFKNSEGTLHKSQYKGHTESAQRKWSTVVLKANCLLISYLRSLFWVEGDSMNVGLHHLTDTNLSNICRTKT